MVLGIVRQAKRVRARTQSLFALTVELAQLEAAGKAKTLGKAAGMGVAAAILGVYAVWFLLAAAAAGLHEWLSLWLSLLIVGAALVLVAVVLVMLARRSATAASPPLPTQAMDETKRTVERLQGGV